VGDRNLFNRQRLFRAPGRTYVLLPHHYHRTTLLDEYAGSWSYIHAGPKHGRRWGFARKDGFRYAGQNSQDGEPTANMMGDT
jgi:hypothetical protein